MITRQIALLSTTAKVSTKELQRVSAALQRQVTRDFAPIWSLQATVDSFDSLEQVPPGYWPITVMDTLPMKGAAGFHLDKHGQPFADVMWSPTWSLTASHEALEMLADPFGHQLASGMSVKPGQGRVTYLVEVCDPCEAAQFAYTINTGLAGEETLVSDFYTPAYFDPVTSSGVRYSFRGSLTAPEQVLNGGYLSWRNPEDGHLWQLFGPAQMGHFVDHGLVTLNREQSDGLVRKARAESAKRKVGTPKNKRGLGMLAACSLDLDNKTGFLNGVTGVPGTLTISDDIGLASFISISYAGAQIGTATSTVTFPIQAGSKELVYKYVSPMGADVEIRACGNLVDSFTSAGRGLKGFTVVGA